MEFIDAKAVYVIFHIIGVAIGAGGAFVSDGMFFSSVKDKVITVTELRFLKLGGAMTWAGLALLIISGLLLFSTNPEAYMQSSKFLVKMSVVVVIALNGIMIHKLLIPCMEACKGKKLTSESIFRKRAPLLLASGAISLTSWILSIVLGSLRSIPYTYFGGMGIYISLLVIGITVALMSKRHVFGV